MNYFYPICVTNWPKAAVIEGIDAIEMYTYSQIETNCSSQITIEKKKEKKLTCDNHN